MKLKSANHKDGIFFILPTVASRWKAASNMRVRHIAVWPREPFYDEGPPYLVTYYYCKQESWYQGGLRPNMTSASEGVGENQTNVDKGGGG